MKTILCAFLVFLFSLHISFAQNTIIDSLKGELKKVRYDTALLKLFTGISGELRVINKFDLALQYSDSAKYIAQKLLSENESKNIRFVVKRELARALINSGLIYLGRGSYPEAIKEFFSALKISEEIAYSNGIAACNIDIGLVYTNQANYNEALKYYESALKIYQAGSDLRNTSVALNNLATVNIKLQRYDTALKQLVSSLKIRDSIGDKYGMANVYNNIGEVYLRQGDHALALKNHMEALKIREAFIDRIGIITSYNNLGAVSTAAGNYKQAIVWLEKALKMSSLTDDKEIRKDIYSSLSEAYGKMKSYSNAYKFHTLYSDLKDSLLNEANSRQIGEIKARYENEKKEKEIELLNKIDEIKTVKIEKQSMTVRYLIGGFSLLVIFSFTAFWLFNQKRKASFRHELLETNMKALRAQMNPHFTFNILNSIQYYAGENDMKSVQHYLRQFAKLMRMILEQSRSSYITLEQEINMLKLYLELEAMRFETKFHYNLRIEDGLDPGNMKIPGMLIQPIVENAIKHGIEQKEGYASIDIFLSVKKNTLSCTVTDNGIGRSESARLKSSGEVHISAGTSILKERIESLNSLYNIHLEYKTEDLYDSSGKPEGTRVIMEIPLNA